MSIPPNKAAGVSRQNPFRLGWTVWLATGSWIGLIPWMPGTFGTLWGLPLAWGISFLPTWAGALAIIAICAAGIPLCTAAVRKLGGPKDPGCIVFDEIASLPITFFLVPNEQFQQPAVLVAGFLLHRLFDITKPPPARQLEHLPEGLGIMADDWAAGVYSCLVLHLLLWWNPGQVFVLGG
jgi:phosphatidylglycerophosphatase A